MAFKFQLGAARMSGSLIQDGGLEVRDDDDTSKFSVDRDTGDTTVKGLLVAAGGAITGSGAMALNGVTALVAHDNLDIGSFNLRAGSLTADGLTATRLVFAGANGLLSDDSDLTFSGDTLTATKLGAFEAAGAINFASQNMTLVDIDSGTIDGATIATSDITVGAGKTLNVSAGTLTTAAAQNLAIMQGAAANVDIGGFDMRAQTLTADSLTSGRVPFASTDGLLVDDSDFTFAGDTLTVTKLGAYEQAGAVDFSDEAMTNVNIDSGAIDGAIVGANSAAAGTFSVLSATSLGSAIDCNNENLTNVDIDSGAIDGTIIGGASAAAGTFTNLVAGGNVDLGDATSDTVTVTGQFDSDLIPSTDSARSLGSSAKRWSTIYVDAIVGADVAFDTEAVAGGGSVSAATDYAVITSTGTVTLPAAVSGKRLYIKLGNATANVIIAPAGGDALPEVTGSLILESTGSAVTLVAYDATNWYIN